MARLMLAMLNPSLHSPAKLVLSILLIDLHYLQAVLFWLVGPSLNCQGACSQANSMDDHMPVVKPCLPL